VSDAPKQSILADTYACLIATRGDLCIECTTEELFEAIERVRSSSKPLREAIETEAQALADVTPCRASEIEEILRRGLVEALARTYLIRGEEDAYLAADALAAGRPDQEIEERFGVAVERIDLYRGTVKGYGYDFEAGWSGAITQTAGPTPDLVAGARAAARSALALD
jgi:hypothetical protein